MLAWSDDYKIGLKELDAQHLILFSIINQIDINIDSGRPADLIEDVLGALRSYVEYHFAFEEGFMRQHGYPDLEHHRDAHGSLSAELAGLPAQSDDRLAQAVRIRKFAIDWLVDHILQEDAAFAEYMREK